MASRYAEPPDPKQILKAVILHEQQAITYTMDYYYPLIRKKIKDYAAACNLQLDEESIEDLAQVVWLIFWMHLMQFE